LAQIAAARRQRVLWIVSARLAYNKAAPERW
jgi:hypothetical protein